MLITFGIKILHNFDLTNTERKNRRKEGFHQLSVKNPGLSWNKISVDKMLTN